MTVAFRPAERRDREFIVGAWETSYQDAHTSGMIPMVMWASVMRPVVEHYLDRAGTKTIVAYNPDDVGGVAELHGFISGEPDERPPIVFYVYVTQPFRRAGIARRLFGALGINPDRPFQYMCSTPIVPTILNPQDGRRRLLATWRPNIARYSREHRERLREQTRSPRR